VFVRARLGGASAHFRSNREECRAQQQEEESTGTAKYERRASSGDPSDDHGGKGGLDRKDGAYLKTLTATALAPCGAGRWNLEEIRNPSRGI
jgi:hypothetical protein